MRTILNTDGSNMRPLMIPTLSATNVVIISDSTAYDYRNSPNSITGTASWEPMSGWGEYAAAQLLPENRLINCAIGGYSAKLYVNLKLDHARNNVFRPGDWLLIAFGCNDARPSLSMDRASAADRDFLEYLGQIIDAAVNAKMNVVVLSCLPRYNFVNSKFHDPLLAPYAEAARKVAEVRKLPFIDTFSLITAAFSGLGTDEVKKHYMFLRPGESGNWPAGSSDPLHFSRVGAQLVWRLILAETRKLNLSLTALFQEADFPNNCRTKGDMKILTP